MRMAIEELERKGIKRVYAHRHEENAASARLMEKSGFEIADTFITLKGGLMAAGRLLFAGMLGN